MINITENLSTTFMEYRLLPGLTKKEHTPDNISLTTPLVKYNLNKKPKISLNLPFTSAVMQAVSGPDLGIALAREGGLSFIYCSQPIENQVAMVSQVKKFKAGFVESNTILSPQKTLKDILDLTKKTGNSTIPITIDGKNNSKLVGLITDKDYWPGMDIETPITELMTPFEDIDFGLEGMLLKEANELIYQKKRSSIPIIDNKKDKNLKYLVFRKDFELHKTSFPNELTDTNKSLIVGAGVGTRDYKKRIPALVKAGVDVLVIDTSDGFSEYASDVIKYTKLNYPDIPIGAGNVVTAKGFNYLTNTGADFIKVGIGGGSICITQEQKGIGRGQVSALRDVVKARNIYAKENGVYVPICSDGGLAQDSNITIALAFGADFVMMGRYFARFKESPIKIVDNNGKPMKQYWGEGSERAKNWQRYHVGGEENKLAFEEGIDGLVPYIGPLRDNVQKSAYIIKSTLSNIGVSSLKELRTNAKLERISPASIREGKAHDIIANTDEGKYKSNSW